MRFTDFKVGQLVGVTFPYSNEPTRKYGFKVLEVLERGAVRVRDVKTNEIRTFDWKDKKPSKTPFYRDREIYKEDVPTWKIVENV